MDSPVGIIRGIKKKGDYPFALLISSDQTPLGIASYSSGRPFQDARIAGPRCLARAAGSSWQVATGSLSFLRSLLRQ